MIRPTRPPYLPTQSAANLLPGAPNKVLTPAALVGMTQTEITRQQNDWVIGQNRDIGNLLRSSIKTLGAEVPNTPFLSTDRPRSDAESKLDAMKIRVISNTGTKGFVGDAPSQIKGVTSATACAKPPFFLNSRMDFDSVLPSYSLWASLLKLACDPTPYSDPTYHTQS